MNHRLFPSVLLTAAILAGSSLVRGNPPTISSPAAQTTTTGVAVGPVALTIGDTETPVAALTLSATTDNPSLLPADHIVFTGQGASRGVSLLPAAGQTGTATATLTVHDGDRETASVTIGLSVTPYGPLPGSFTLNGTNWTYDPGDGGSVISGVLIQPTVGTAPFPAVLISHGAGGNASGFSAQRAAVMKTWGLVCIGPNYTHSSSEPGGPHDRDGTDGWSPENERRARACLEILASLGTVDMTRVALFGHSKGSFVSAGLASAIGFRARAVVASACGAEEGPGQSDGIPLRPELQSIQSPFVTMKGGNDTVVREVRSALLQDILRSNGIEHERYIFEYGTHNVFGNASADGTAGHPNEGNAVAQYWLTKTGVLATAGKAQPQITAVADQFTTTNTPTGDIPFTVSSPTATVTAYSSNLQLVPATGIVLGGSGTDRTIRLTPLAGATDPYTRILLVATDGTLVGLRSFTLTVGASAVTAPSISAIPSVTALVGAPVGPIPFTIDDPDPDTLVIETESGFTKLLPDENIALAGSGADRTVTLAPDANYAGVVRVKITARRGSVPTSATYSGSTEKIVVEQLGWARASATFQVVFNGTGATRDPLLPLLAGKPDGSIDVTWTGAAGTRYMIEFSDDLTTWTPTGPVRTASGFPLTWTDDGATTGTLPALAMRRFYRIAVVD